MSRHIRSAILDSKIFIFRLHIVITHRNTLVKNYVLKNVPRKGLCAIWDNNELMHSEFPRLLRRNFDFPTDPSRTLTDFHWQFLISSRQPHWHIYSQIKISWKITGRPLAARDGFLTGSVQVDTIIHRRNLLKIILYVVMTTVMVSYH